LSFYSLLINALKLFFLVTQSVILIAYFCEQNHTAMLNIIRNTFNFSKLQSALSLVAIFLFSTKEYKAQFSVGNLVVLQVGNGVNTLTSTGNPLFFNEYSISGAFVSSVAIPSAGANAMVLRGSATSEGYISRSGDGNNIVFGAYLQALPNSTVLNTSSSSSINRGIGLINGAGVFTVGASSTSFFTGGDIRGAAATNATNLWASGSSQGSNYFGTASTATTVQISKTNLRASHVFNNQLYISSQVATGTPTDIGVYAVGSGTPNTSGQTVTTVINCGAGAQPGQFFFDPTGTICYVADARNSSLGGIQKWVNMVSINTWTLAYTLPTGTAAVGAFGVVADFSGLNPKVYATTTESSGNRLIAINDVGASSTATTLATASTSNTIFRGLVFLRVLLLVCQRVLIIRVIMHLYVQTKILYLMSIQEAVLLLVIPGLVKEYSVQRLLLTQVLPIRQPEFIP
jgi:hypothetical protein